MDIQKFMANDEILIESHKNQVYLTNMRVIFHKGKIDSYFKDLMLDSIDTITYTKKHYSWMIGAGLATFATSLLISYFLKEFNFLIMILGIILSLAWILSYIFLVDKQVILGSKESKMELKGVGVEFIGKLRNECYKQKHSNKQRNDGIKKQNKKK